MVMWLALCFSVFWGDGLKLLIYAVLFGAAVWFGSVRLDQRLSARTQLVLDGILLGLLILVLAVFRCGAYPGLTVLAATGFGAAMLVGKYLRLKSLAGKAGLGER